MGSKMIQHLKKQLLLLICLLSLAKLNAQNNKQTKSNLKQFWKEFQIDVASDNKDKVANYFKFPFMNAFKYFKGEDSNMGREKFLQYYDVFFTSCVKQAIIDKKIKDLTKQDNGFYFTIHYPPPSDSPAGGGAVMFIFKQQTDKIYKVTIISCAGGCEDDNCE